MFDLISTTEQTNTSSNIIKNQKADTKHQINLIKSPKTRINKMAVKWRLTMFL